MSSKATFADVSLPTRYLNSDAAATEHDDIPSTEPSTEPGGILTPITQRSMTVSHIPTEHDGIPYTYKRKYGLFAKRKTV